jgi:hypothetical protein
LGYFQARDNEARRGRRDLDRDLKIDAPEKAQITRRPAWCISSFLRRRRSPL